MLRQRHHLSTEIRLHNVHSRGVAVQVAHAAALGVMGGHVAPSGALRLEDGRAALPHLQHPESSR
eukprot:4916357-Pyramimonas_sp.AAC.1